MIADLTIFDADSIARGDEYYVQDVPGMAIDTPATRLASSTCLLAVRWLTRNRKDIPALRADK